ncbi:ABC-F family ATP-binding cassette domain-containing protein [Legionella cardiaca]|uniref:ATP-binding cassette domain-containing protein n=1 Tax=Legionella cardiaca TaxID=1071983 RepID=A0ABY8AY03_9GAMM|nr:ATP-binding cassette domain-containing protein [Legionella cardiaca]WED43987.1 ATP-binding cassette domain-containing protein [Legionella cardiaca]
MHKPIQFKNFGLSFPQKQCFLDFSAEVLYGSRIAIIGRNGTGKSTLLKAFNGTCVYHEGSIHLPDNIKLGYLPQIIDTHEPWSGGERLNRTLTAALCHSPNLLLLDEPTNHLDKRNRISLMRMLQFYLGTLIIVSHDTELLRNSVDTLWHIDNGKIHIFSGNYDDYIREKELRRLSIENELTRLNRQKKGMHDKLRQEQQRTAKSCAKGEKKVANRKWLKTVGDLKGMKAEKSQGKKLKVIDSTKANLTNRLAELSLPESIVPKFYINSHKITNRPLVQIASGALEYFPGKPLLSNIGLTISGRDRIALIGDNGSGKSTFVKAIFDDGNLKKTGTWILPNRTTVGYLDQHYQNLHSDKTVLEMVALFMPKATNNDLRAHLNDFLFRKTEEVETTIADLSGGEKARLSLCCIAAKTPALLILDEITNNLDLETRAHVIQVLKNYPGAMIVISHDDDFLQSIEIEKVYLIRQGTIAWVASLEKSY